MHISVFKNNQSVSFFQWENKHYSIFRSLGKVIRICTLLYSSNIIAQTPVTNILNDTIRLEEVQISSGRIPGYFPDNARLVTLITSTDIPSYSSVSIQDLLEPFSFLDIRTRGPLGIQSEVGMRGGNHKQTLILLNGIKLTDPQTSLHNLNLPIDIDDLERVEILQGPGSRIYGPHAFNGAINFISQPATKNHLKFHIKAGDFGFFKAHINANINVHGIKNQFSFTRNESSGYIHNTDYVINKLYWQVQKTFGRGILNLQTGYIERAFGAQNFYSTAFPNQFEQTRTKLISIDYQYSGIFELMLRSYWRRNHDRFELFREDKDYYQKINGLWISENDTAPPFYKHHNYHMTDLPGIEVNTVFDSRLGKTSIGSEFRYELIQSNVIGKKMDSTKAPGELNGFFNKNRNRSNLSIFLEHQLSSPKYSLNIGYLLNWNSDYNWKGYGGVDLGIKLNDLTKLFLSINQSLRLPTFTELYYHDAVHVSNPDLNPEEAITLEAGCKLSSSGISGQASVFHRWSNNLIDWIKDPDNLLINDFGDTLWESRNYSEINTIGTNISFSINIQEIIPSMPYFQKIYLDYTFLHMAKNSESFISSYVLDYLKHKLTLGSCHPLSKHLSFNLRYTFMSRNSDISQPIIYDFKPFGLLDATISFTHKEAELYLEMKNILDTKYRDYANIAMPGRWLGGGLKYNFKFGKNPQTKTSE